MEKVIWLLWGEPGSCVDLVGDLGELATAPGVRALTVLQHDEVAAEAPAPVPVPAGERLHVALVSAWLDNYQVRAPVEAAVAATTLLHDSYLVVESLVEDYGTTPHAPPCDWPDGARSPGVLTVALIHRPADLDEAQWLHNWHEVQSPASGRLQPRARYVRNHVVRPLSAGAPAIDGIVEEAWPSTQHVADPMLFFNAGGDPAVLQRNVEEMMANVAACLDLDRLRSTTMSEYLVKTMGGWP